MKNLSLLIMVMALFMSCTRSAEKEVQKPNILFLLADDLGYGELGSYGQEIILTPVLNGLANKGMRFTDFYAGTSVCSPSRAVLMTGKHAGHSSIRGNNGVFDNDVWDRVALKKEELSLGEMLGQAGYQTAFIGKWHLDDPNDESTWAMNRGFEYAVQEQWSSRFGGKEYDGLVHWINSASDSIRYDQESYDCIDEFRTDFVLEYLDQKEEDKPFFIFMSYRIPHAHERYIRNKELYAGQGWSETELYDLENDLFETKDLANEYPEITQRINQLFREARTDTEGFPYGGKIQDYKARDRYLKRQTTN